MIDILRPVVVQKCKEKIPYLVSHLSESPSDRVREAIIDALVSELKAFPEYNDEIWKDTIKSQPSDVLLIGEKEVIAKMLEEAKDRFFEGYSLKDIT